MSKLTLRIDDRVVSRARRYARQSGVSVSKMVEAYLTAVLQQPSAAGADAPVLRAVRGSLKKARLSEYKRRLAAKYR